MKTGAMVLVGWLCLCIGVTANAKPTKEKKMEAKNPTVTLQTNLGNIVVELWTDKAPKSVENFLGLVKKGFYDGVKFHRVIPGFMIQGGDPLTKDPAKKGAWGTGGPGYKFADEPVKGEYARGTLAMANAGPDTNGSQFFICVVDLAGKLPKNYNLFGKVTSGMDVADKIAATPRDGRDCPLADVTIQKATTP